MATIADAVSEAVSLPVSDLRVACPAAQAIAAALAAARASGSRAAVCLADLSSPSRAGGRPSLAGPDVGDGHIRRWLRRTDRLVCVNDAIVVVAWGLSHPSDAEGLAERLRRAISASGGHDAGIGLALFPTHGDDPSVLLERARQSAERDRQQRQELWEGHASA